MRQVTQAFMEAMTARERRVTAKVVVDYTNPDLDQSIEASANDQASISYPAQTADAVSNPPYKWASLDGSCILDGSYHPMPDTPEDAERYQVGWWSRQLAGADGYFAEPYPTLTVTFISRPVHSLRVVGDSARGEWPVDFVIRMYSGDGTLLHEETVTGNTEMDWRKPLDPPITQVTRMELEVRRWSHPGRQAKILEFFTSVQQTYLPGDLLEISLLEEREVSQSTLPVGSISANEITIKLSNDDRRFDADNAQSPLYELLKPNRRIRAWLGAVLPDGTEEYVPLGVFWSTEWQANDDTVEATVVARDRLERLRSSTYQSSQVVQGASLYDLAVMVLSDAGLAPEDYWVDPALQQWTVPYAWFNPVSHREALRIIAEAGLAQVYCDRDGVVRVERQPVGGEPVLDITPDNYFKLNNPMRPNQVANEVIVTTQPLRPVDTPEEVYRSNEPVAIETGQNVTLTVYYSQPPVIEAAASLEGAPSGVSITGATYYGWGAEVTITNTSGAPASVTLVIHGRPLKVQNQERAVARDEASIIENGVLRYEFPANPLVQSLSVAQQIADMVLASAKDPRRDLEIDWRGNPAVELGDVVRVKGRDYTIIRQEITWAGALSEVSTGRRVS